MRTIGIANIIIGTYSQVYNVYFRSIRWRVDAPRSRVFLRAGTFVQLEFRGVGTIRVASIIVEVDSQEYNVYYTTIRRRPDAPD